MCVQDVWIFVWVMYDNEINMTKENKFLKINLKSFIEINKIRKNLIIILILK